MVHFFRSEIVIQLGIFMQWPDTRLLSKMNCTGMPDPEILKKIWTPHPFLYYSSSIKVVDTLKDKTELFEKTPEKLSWWLKADLGIQCRFDFSYYPFDSQACTLKLSSMDLRDTVVKYVTSSLDREYGANMQHELAYEIEYELLTDPKDLTVDYGGGSYSISGFMMTLKRRKSSFVANFFFPSFLIVLTAFVSFWVPPASIPGRMALLITTYLVLTNMSSSAMSFNAPVFTAMDVWFYVCKMTVVAAIFEFAAILKILNSSKTSPQKMNSNKPREAFLDQKREMEESGKARLEARCRKIDNFAFFAFNAGFVAFSGTYGLFCLYRL